MAAGNGIHLTAGALTTYQKAATTVHNDVSSALTNNQVPPTLDFGQQTIRDLPGAEQLAQAYTTLVQTYLGGSTAIGGTTTEAGQSTGVPLFVGQVDTLNSVAGQADSLYKQATATETQAVQLVQQSMADQTTG